MGFVYTLPALLLGGVLVVWHRRWSNHRIAASRVPTLAHAETARVIRVSRIEPVWATVLPWIAGIGAYLLAGGLTPMGPVFCAAMGFLAWIMGQLVRQAVVGRRTVQIEAQLAEAIDHVVTSLHAGVGVIDALTTAERASKRPLESHLSQLLLRLRLGDDPAEVCKEMADLLPLESFRLFYQALGVQWEGGGSLAPTLATTGRFIRDRVELGRQVRARTTEARFSVLAILGLTYFLALLMWNVDADRVRGFLGSGLGEAAVSGAIVMQALGAGWIARISRIRY